MIDVNQYNVFAYLSHLEETIRVPKYFFFFYSFLNAWILFNSNLE